MLNSKWIQWLFEAFESIMDKKINKAPFCKALIAEVKSVQSTTVTIRFDGDSADIPGVGYIAGVTLLTGNKVTVLILNNSNKSSDYIILKKA